MRADQGERVVRDDKTGRHSTQTLLTAIAVLILAGAAYLLAPGDEGPEPTPDPMAEIAETPAPALPPRPTPAEAIAAAPDIPEPSTAAEADTPEVSGTEVEDQTPDPIAEPEASPPAPAPPTPEELDARLRAGLADADLVVDEPLGATVAAPYLLDRTVSSLDQAARGLVPRRTLNLPRPPEPFPTQREGQVYRMDPRGYARYDALVKAATKVSVDTLAGLFQRFRPELTSAYASLGYPADAMDNTLIAALDAILAVPVLSEPPELRSKGAVWAYADPELEAASDLQKQILRTGPDNTRALQRWARDLKTRLLNP